jgi:hypothetical protein
MISKRRVYVSAVRVRITPLSIDRHLHTIMHIYILGWTNAKTSLLCTCLLESLPTPKVQCLVCIQSTHECRLMHTSYSLIVHDTTVTISLLYFIPILWKCGFTHIPDLTTISYCHEYHPYHGSTLPGPSKCNIGPCAPVCMGVWTTALGPSGDEISAFGMDLWPQGRRTGHLWGLVVWY